MTLPVLFDIAIAVVTIGAILAYRDYAPMRVVFRYFTTQSNVLCAVSCLLAALFRLGGEVPQSLLLLRYAGTAAVTVTMLTVLLFLGPFVYGYEELFKGPDLYLHLICPAASIASFFLWDKPDMAPEDMLLGVLPVALYGMLYLRHVIYTPEPSERHWEDFYGFNRHGKWPLSLLMMLAATALVSWALWAA